MMKKGRICDLYAELKVGMLVRTKGDGAGSISTNIEGVIGEINLNSFYIHHNITGKNGTLGSIDPSTNKCKFSWKINRECKEEIKIFNYKRKAKKKMNGITCQECKGKFSSSSMKKVGEEYYCLDCFENYFVVCANCGNPARKTDTTTISNTVICKKCVEDNYIVCSVCGTYVHIDDKYSNDDEDDYCETCYNERYFCCEACESDYNRDESYSGADDNLYCQGCFDERFVCCSNCHSTQWRDDIRYNEEEDEYLCTECFDGGGQAREPKIIHDYGYKPTPDFKQMKWQNITKEWVTDLFMGVELEIQHPEYDSDKPKKLEDFLTKEKVIKRFYFKKDGSVDKGFEIVSHPFTLSYAHKKIKFQKILNWLKDNKFTSFESGECGLHVHLDKKFFEDLDITKMRLFFAKNKDKLDKFSKREGIGTNYCQFETASTKDIINGYSQSGRYWALNLNSSEETIEMRLFRGTLDYKRFVAILQFADAISHFVKEHGVASFLYGEYKYKNNSWELFVDWVKQENKYKQMINLFKEEQLCV